MVSSSVCASYKPSDPQVAESPLETKIKDKDGIPQVAESPLETKVAYFHRRFVRGYLLIARG